jgi:type II secretory pathway pseudopilin PulG
MNTQIKKKRGFALTEVLMAIAIIIIIGIVAYPLYTSSRNKAQTMQLADSMVAFNVYIQNLLSQQQDTTYLSNETSQQIIDQFNASQSYNLPDDGTTLQVGAWSPQYFFVTFQGNIIPQSSCVDFVNTIAKSYDYVMVYTNDFGGSVIQDLNNIQNGGVKTLTAGGVGEACQRTQQAGGLIEIVNHYR